MSKKNKKFKELYEAERQEKLRLQQQLQNMDVGFIVFIKSRIKKFLNLFSLLKIKSFKIDSKFKILNSKLSIIVPSLCLLFVVGLVYFFVLAEPADQLPQNQTFLNLAHSHINASTTAPITYTSTSTHTSQADFEASGAGGFGYSATTTAGYLKPSGISPSLAETSFYRSPRMDLGGATKVGLATVTKTTSTGTDLKTYIRSGNTQTIDTDSIPSLTYRDTSKAEFEAGLTQTGTTNVIVSTPNPTLVGQNGTDEFVYNQISAQADPPAGSTGFGAHTNLGIGSSASDQTTSPFLYRLADGTYRLYYQYYNGTYWQLSYKTSANGTTDWSARVDLGIGTSASDQAGDPFLYRLSDGTYRLYYNYYNGAYGQLSYRTSADGIIGWSARVDLGIGTSASDHAVSQFLYRLSDGTYRLYYYYNNSAYWQLAYQTSANGITGWSARVDLGIGTSASDQAAGPFLYRLSDGTYRLYYTYYNGTYHQLSYKTQSMVSASSTFSSSILDLGNAYFGDLLAIQLDAPTGTTLTTRVRAGSTATPDAASWDVAGTNWTVGSTPVSATVGTSPQVLVASVPGAWNSYRYWQYKLDGTTNGTNTWVVRDVFFIPRATGYGRL
ncbi:exo-alpha-sialidase, partial [Patescibacteria group bacterium]|nr:exo-alpha-sialidase [Patescibacteria group bacterium]